MATDYDQLQLVAFSLGAEEYAVPVHSVEGIIKVQEPTKVPGSAAHVRGVMNLRGKVISIVDLRRRFDMEPLADESDARVLVVHHGQKNVGVLVDAVSEVLTLSASDLQPPPPEVGSEENRAIESICRVEERLVIIVDLGAILSDEDKPGREQAPSTAAPSAGPAEDAATDETQASHDADDAREPATV
jgi:purine-binding chemotaxis protein CheW